MNSEYTVVVPAKSDCAYLKESIASILAQTLQPSRVLIVVNPGESLDSPTAHLVTEYRGYVELHESPVPGMVSALNFGISLAETEFIGFLDSDDLWLPDKQERQIALLELDHSLDAVNCMAMNFRDDPKLGRLEMNTANAVMFTAMTFRQSVFQRIGGVDPTATHFNWLYRWISQARQKGFAVQSTECLGILRRLHEENSWVTQNQTATSVLMAELRSNFARIRQGNGS